MKLMSSPSSKPEWTVPPYHANAKPVERPGWIAEVPGRELREVMEEALQADAKAQPEAHPIPGLIQHVNGSIKEHGLPGEMLAH